MLGPGDTNLNSTLLAAGYFVSATTPAHNPLDRNTGNYAARSVLQRELSHDGFWIVDLQGQGRHSRHFWADKLRHWVDSADQRARYFNDLLRSKIIVRTGWANAALLAAGYWLLTAPPSDADGFILSVTHDATTRTTDTARMTLSDIGQWLFRMETASADARTPVGDDTAQAVLLCMGYVANNPQWWTPAPLRDTTLTRLYCKDGIWSAPTHPRGRMYQRLRGLDSIHSGYITRGQLLAMIAHSRE